MRILERIGDCEIKISTNLIILLDTVPNHILSTLSSYLPGDCFNRVYFLNNYSKTTITRDDFISRFIRNELAHED